MTAHPLSPFPLDPDLAAITRLQVPRYTSYPTAPHFSPEVTGEIAAQWMEKAEGPISLYLHVPFCRSICAYCGCTTKAARQDAPVRAFAAVLEAEIAMLARRIGRRRVSHLHWGGGTPNILPADVFSRLVSRLHDHFEIAPDAEHAIELDPRHLDAGMARELARNGINRASLGVQTLDPRVQEAIGRIQPAETIDAAFAALRGAGIAAINADLMYGLPRQSEDSVAQAARAMRIWRPSRIALFGYAHVPWMKSHQKLVAESDLPDGASRRAQAALAREILLAEGYVPIGIDHFAWPDDPLAEAGADGTLRRNFQGYTIDGAQSLIGLGPSSISQLPAGFAQNAPDLSGWRRAIEAGRFATVRGRALTDEDRMRGAIISDLLCTFTSDIAARAAQFGVPLGIVDESLRKLESLRSAGFLILEGHRLTISRHQTELARVVAAQFDAYLGQSGRHSVAV